MKKTILISYYIKLFEEGIYFVPEMLIAAKAMLGAMSMPSRELNRLAPL